MEDLQNGNILNNRYIIQGKLGTGGFSVVYLVLDNQDIEKKALKLLTNIDKNSSYLNEIKILKDLKSDACSYIIQYFDNFKWNLIEVIVTEYCGNGDLGELINKLKKDDQKLNEKKLNLWLDQMIKGLYYLHSKNIIHRDIKPSNIFITEKGDIKLGDLGIAKYDNNTKKTTVGTVNYMSPEIIEEENYSKKTDMWSLGCVLYELLTHQKLFDDITDFKIMNQIMYKEIKIPKKINNKTYKIIKRCLIRKPLDRLDSKKALKYTKDEYTNETDQHLLLTAQLASGSLDKTIRIWNTITGECIKILEENFSEVNCLAVLSTDQLASGSLDKTIRIWNTMNGECVKILEGHSSGVMCLAPLSTDQLASGSFDKTIRIWNTISGECIKTLEGHTNEVYCLAVLSTGQLVSGSRDYTIRTWNTMNGECVETLEGHTNEVYCLTVLSTV